MPKSASLAVSNTTTSLKARENIVTQKMHILEIIDLFKPTSAS